MPIDDDEKGRDAPTEMMVFTGEGGATVSPYLIDGQVYFVARDVGRVLGYHGDGRKLVNKITQDWAAEFIEGTDFVRLTGKKLREFNELRFEGPESGPSNSRSLLVLTEQGANLACMLTKKPIGVQMRRWLASDLLPKLRRGDVDGVMRAAGHDAPRASTPTPSTPVPVWDMPGLSARDAAIHRRFTAKLLREVAHLPTVIGAHRQALMVRAAEVASGVPMVNALPAPDPEPEWTTEQLMEMFKDEFGFSSSASTLGRIASAAGITTEPVDPRLVRKMRQQRKGGSFQDCPGWAYTAAGVEALREAARAWQEEYNAKQAAKEARAAEREAKAKARAEAAAEREMKRQERAAAKAEREKRKAERDAERAAAREAKRKAQDAAHALEPNAPALPGLDKAEGDQ